MSHQRNRDFIITFKDEKVATENFQINRKRNFAKPTTASKRQQESIINTIDKIRIKSNAIISQ